jgi:hypothetical protein
VKVLKVSSTLGAGQVVCDGAEVLDAGGRDEDRLEYARAEAADLLTSDVEAAQQFPARVSLLPGHLPYLVGGGQPCANRFEMVEAIRVRLAALKPGWRIEGRGRERGIISVYEDDVPDHVRAE